jgi:hypothetical protein
MANRPDIKLVSHWDIMYQSDLVTVEMGDVPFDGFRAEIWRVKPAKETGVRAKTFYGETAWMDARRLAADIDFGAWSL